VPLLRPARALAPSPKFLEVGGREVFEPRCNEPPGTRPLENLLQRLSKDGHFPPVLDAYANSIRLLGNTAVHAKDLINRAITVDEAHQSLTQLMLIVQWYT